MLNPQGLATFDSARAPWEANNTALGGNRVENYATEFARIDTNDWHNDGIYISPPRENVVNRDVADTDDFERITPMVRLRFSRGYGGGIRGADRGSNGRRTVAEPNAFLNEAELNHHFESGDEEDEDVDMEATTIHQATHVTRSATRTVGRLFLPPGDYRTHRESDLWRALRQRSQAAPAVDGVDGDEGADGDDESEDDDVDLTTPDVAQNSERAEYGQSSGTLVVESDPDTVVLAEHGPSLGDISDVPMSLGDVNAGGGDSNDAVYDSDGNVLEQTIRHPIDPPRTPDPVVSARNAIRSQWMQIYEDWDRDQEYGLLIRRDPQWEGRELRTETGLRTMRMMKESLLLVPTVAYELYVADPQFQYWIWVEQTESRYRDWYRFQRGVADELLRRRREAEAAGEYDASVHPPGSVSGELMRRRLEQLGRRTRSRRNDEEKDGGCRETAHSDEDRGNRQRTCRRRTSTALRRVVEELHREPRDVTDSQRYSPDRPQRWSRIDDAILDYVWGSDESSSDVPSETAVNRDNDEEHMQPYPVLVKVPGTAEDRNAFSPVDGGQQAMVPADGTHYRIGTVWTQTGADPLDLVHQFVSEQLDPYLMAIIMERYLEVRDENAWLSQHEDLLPEHIRSHVEPSDARNRNGGSDEKPDANQVRLFNYMLLSGIAGWLSPQHPDTPMPHNRESEMSELEERDEDFRSSSPTVEVFGNAMEVWEDTMMHYGQAFYFGVGSAPITTPRMQPRTDDDTYLPGFAETLNPNLYSPSLIFAADRPANLGPELDIPPNPVINRNAIIEPDYDGTHFYAFQAAFAVDNNIYPFYRVQFGHLFAKYRHNEAVRHADWGQRHGVVDLPSPRSTFGRYRIRRNILRSYESMTVNRHRGGGEAHPNPIRSAWRVIPEWTVTVHCKPSLRGIFCSPTVMLGDSIRCPQKWCHLARIPPVPVMMELHRRGRGPRYAALPPRFGACMSSIFCTEEHGGMPYHPQVSISVHRMCQCTLYFCT